MSFRDRELIIKTINKYNKAKSGKGDGEFDSNVMEGGNGFDPVNLE
tara:strand:+ start:1240 stop:1377 length:138 start_codon:yes stop_codon:yes gene_type:complete